MIPENYDVFVSHASEDKARFVDSFVAALQARGLDVWYDANEIRLGDDFRKRMDDGLAKSRFGVVVLSPNFFKYWPEAELSALFNQERVFDQTRILPIRLDIDHRTLTTRSPLLATRAAVGWEVGVSELARLVHDRVRDVPVAPRTVRSPVYNLPVRRARRLFGREDDIRRLDAMLEPGRDVSVAASIEGLAGVGKTELALHVVDRLSESSRFPGGIFWLDAENPHLVVAWGTTIADALGVGVGPVEERAAAAVRIASRGEPVLVVLDNVEHWTRQTEPWPLPRGSQTALLVTTRQRGLAGQSFEHFELETLPQEAAREFLFAGVGRDLSAASGTGDLLHHLDGHTLAIELAGAYLREFPDVTPAAYLQKLSEGVPVEEKVQDRVRYERTVSRALHVHWDQLDDTAREGLLVAACFAPEDASIELLESCGVDAEARQPLRRFHLIGGDGARWRMHRLVREWARHSASAENRDLASVRFVEGCVEFSRRINLAEGYRVYSLDGQHLEEAVRRAEAALGASDPRVSVLLKHVAIGLKSLSVLPRAKELLETALRLALKNLDEEDPSIATLRSYLALVLQDLGELPRAKELLELALAAGLKSQDHPSVAICRSNLALVLKDLGAPAQARELLELALEWGLENLGEAHSFVAKNRSNLALVLQDLGELPRAKALLELALESDLKNLGEDHPSVAIRRFNLAAVARDTGNLAHARELFAQSLSTHERSLGADHPATSFTRVTLASVLHQVGEIALASAEAERALRAVATQPEGSWYRTHVERIAEQVLGEP